MASVAQIDANRSNAQKSTGPRTPEGKETASQNAITHGLFAREGVIRGEDGEEFEMHQERLLDQLNPAGALEEILAERIVDLSWRLKRAVQDQSEAFAALYDRQTAEAEEPGNAALLSGNRKKANPEIGGPGPAMIGRMILEDFSQDAVLERLLRYERRIENSLYRTLNELRRVHDQVQKAALEDVSTLERWREEDWNARKARAFAFCPPPGVSPGPAGGTTNTPTAEVPHPYAIPSLPYASPAPDGPPGDETCKTNPICGSPRGTGILPVDANHGQDGDPGPQVHNSALGSPTKREEMRLGTHATIPPDGVTTNLAQDQGQLCETNPISEGVSSGDRSCKSEVSSLKVEGPVANPPSLSTSDFPLQT